MNPVHPPESDTLAPARARELSEGLVAALRDLGALRTVAVEGAIRSVPRHRFLPEESPEAAYEAERALVTKRDRDGLALSSVSAARIQAFMLEQADIRPGMRVLEIGSGGLNAALLTELVGDHGEVTTIDIDPDVVDRARRLLERAGYQRVRTVLADGALGEPGNAPYDRIMVTAEAADIPRAWVNQLRADGRIVVPLRVRGLTRSLALTRQDAHLVARDYEVCGFVPMRGTSAVAEQLVVLHDGSDEQVGLRLDDGRADTADTTALRNALSAPRMEAWSGVSMGRGLPYDDFDLWLATNVSSYALLAATRKARERGIVASWSPMGISTILDDLDQASFAYLTMRPTTTQRTTFEFGAIGHGHRAGTVAAQLVEQIQRWDREGRGVRAEFRIDPPNTPDAHPARGWVLERPSSRITVSWPPLDSDPQAGQAHIPSPTTLKETT